jgi:pRiA4b ORF-3-like protein
VSPVSQGFGRSAPPSRRRARRADVVTYRIRIDLADTRPPLWRRLELASDMRLDELHDVLQVAFGWTDSHLHRFGAGPESYSDETEYYLCPFDVEEGEVGIPEQEVRLDEVLVDVGDSMFYLYDFGDGWEHTVALEAVQERAGSVPRAVCTEGRRPGPAEDCGGVTGYELYSAATDATHPQHAAARTEFARMYGPEVEPHYFTSTPFDVEAINKELAGLPQQRATDAPEPLTNLLHAIRDSRERIRLQGLIGAAMAGEPPTIDSESAARMVRPYTWLLERVGDDGITLTGAGYLPPAHVEAAVSELGLADEWIGKHNRENQTLPVLHLRESAQKAGLLRKYRGDLLLTARARRLRTDPVRLWWHLAEQLPLKSKDPCEYQAGLLLLIGIAAASPGDLDASVAQTLHAIGWMHNDGTPLTSHDAAHAAWDTRTALHRMSALAGKPYRGEEQSTPDGIAFARAALRTWPAGA